MTKSKQQSSTIAFRVDQHLALNIDRARKPFGFSRGEFVRWAIIDRFENATGASTADAIRDLRSTVASSDDMDQLLAVALKHQQSLRKLTFWMITALGSLGSEDAKQLLNSIFPE